MAGEIVADIDDILSNKSDKEDPLRGIFNAARNYMQPEISELLADYRNKRCLGTCWPLHDVCGVLNNLL